MIKRTFLFHRRLHCDFWLRADGSRLTSKNSFIVFSCRHNLFLDIRSKQFRVDRHVRCILKVAQSACACLCLLSHPKFILLRLQCSLMDFQRLLGSFKDLLRRICVLLRLAPKEQADHGTTHLEDRPLARLFAVIIGINTYDDPKVPDLAGAVADADAVSDFLITKLGVPKNRIVNLRNRDATRLAIKDALSGLAAHPNISANDPILIYFAGHGSETASPLPRWETSRNDGVIQMLLPADFIYEGTNGSSGQGVFDLMLSTILADIARNKSDNMAVILDCCHSGSGTRISSEDNIGIRGVDLPPEYTIPLDIISQVIENIRGSYVFEQFQKSGLMSHVLLAACMQKEQAREARGRGAFTRALLDLLQREDFEQLAYEDIIMRLPDLPDQHPQCEGANRRRIIFNTKTVDFDGRRYNIRPGPSSSYILSAGEAHGIAHMAKFDVYSESSSSRVGSVTAQTVEMFTTHCYTEDGEPFSLSVPAYVVQTHLGIGHDIRIQIDDADQNRGLFIAVLEGVKNSTGQSYCLVQDSAKDKPDLGIRTKGASVHFDIMDEQCRTSGLTHMPFDIPIDAPYLLSVLRSATDFYRHLHHARRLGPGLSALIDVECLKLVPSGEYTDEIEEIYVPEPNGINMIIDGRIQIDVDEVIDYGYRITSRTSRDLFAALFYFDMSDMSIEPYYVPSAAKDGNTDFSIPAFGTLSVGFGDSGTAPRIYKLKEDQTIDIGYLKLYLSTKFIDYSYIAQPSPFSSKRGQRPYVFRDLNTDLWDTIVIPILQSKGVVSKSESEAATTDV